MPLPFPHFFLHGVQTSKNAFPIGMPLARTVEGRHLALLDTALAFSRAEIGAHGATLEAQLESELEDSGIMSVHRMKEGITR